MVNYIALVRVRTYGGNTVSTRIMFKASDSRDAYVRMCRMGSIITVRSLRPAKIQNQCSLDYKRASK